ncbi:MAG TPA: AbrB/MazE/SpoVT family DNA-binding domain-containing protein [Planctomycetota bacterium]|nr:AbrB/MazE/SpoVT family DNA-binding domain-containing protein [Planctomycetota bacterium]
MASIRMTAKRQATFPRAVCEEMRLSPGDKVALDRRVVDGELVWVLRPEKPSVPKWFGSLRRYARGKCHSMDAIRKSIEKAKKRGTI